MLDSSKIIVPAGVRKAILTSRHKTHKGHSWIKNLTNQMYHWPGMSSDMQNMTSKCSHCTKQEEEQIVKQTSVNSTLRNVPMQHMAAEIHTTNNEDNLILADNCSGYVATKKQQPK